MALCFKKYRVLIKLLINPFLHDCYFLNNFKQNKAYLSFQFCPIQHIFYISWRSRCLLQIIPTVQSSRLLNLFLQLARLFIVSGILSSHFSPLMNSFNLGAPKEDNMDLHLQWFPLEIHAVIHHRLPWLALEERKFRVLQRIASMQAFFTAYYAPKLAAKTTLSKVGTYRP